MYKIRSACLASACASGDKFYKEYWVLYKSAHARQFGLARQKHCDSAPWTVKWGGREDVHLMSLISWIETEQGGEKTTTGVP